MRVLRVHGGKPKYFHALIGGNFRIDELQAAVLRVKLKYLDGWTAGAPAQRRLSTMLRSRGPAWAAALITPYARRGAGTSSTSTSCASQRRDALQAFLAERGIGTEIYYPVPLHLQAVFRLSRATARGDFPHSERAAAETLALPIYPELERGAARARGRERRAVLRLKAHRSSAQLRLFRAS